MKQCNKTNRKIPSLILLMLFCCITASAQQFAARGVVVDGNGVPVIGAAVTLKGNETVGVITDLDGNIIGETGLLRMFPAWHQTDLTIIIPDPEMQHKGFGSEAIRIMLDMAFHEYEMHRVSIGVVGLNTDALEFYKKIGFKQEGILEEAYYYNDEYSDFIMMRILSQEWK